MKDMIKMELREDIERIKEMMNICDGVTVYFAHPINTYNTKYESLSIDMIKDKFPNSTIINPGEQSYQDSFKEYVNNDPEEYMGYFKDLVNTCSVIVYLPFNDGKIGAGVRYEIFHLHKRFDEIYEINPNDYSIRKVSMLYVDDNTLSIDETRQRIKQEY
jgi:hypothetical protein